MAEKKTQIKLHKFKAVLNYHLDRKGFQWDRGSGIKAGSNNEITFYKNPRGDRRVVRISLDGVDEDDVAMWSKSLDNWERANRLGVCPLLHFAGFVKDGPQTRLLIIMDAYPMTLGEYLKTANLKSRTHREIIAIKIYTLLMRIAQELNLDCTDIKLENVVINPKGVDIRVIDIDGDFCKPIPNIEPGINGLIAVMVLANHLFYNNQINVLAPLLISQFESICKQRDKLYKLYCTKVDNPYRLLVRFYLQGQGTETSHPCEPGEFNTFLTNALQEQRSRKYKLATGRKAPSAVLGPKSDLKTKLAIGRKAPSAVLDPKSDLKPSSELLNSQGDPTTVRKFVF